MPPTCSREACAGPASACGSTPSWSYARTRPPGLVGALRPGDEGRLRAPGRDRAEDRRGAAHQTVAQGAAGARGQADREPARLRPLSPKARATPAGRRSRTSEFALQMYEHAIAGGSRVRPRLCRPWPISARRSTDESTSGGLSGSIARASAGRQKASGAGARSSPRPRSPQAWDPLRQRRCLRGRAAGLARRGHRAPARPRKACYLPGSSACCFAQGQLTRTWSRSSPTRRIVPRAEGDYNVYVPHPQRVRRASASHELRADPSPPEGFPGLEDAHLRDRTGRRASAHSPGGLLCREQMGPTMPFGEADLAMVLRALRRQTACTTRRARFCLLGPEVRRPWMRWRPGLARRLPCTPDWVRRDPDLAILRGRAGVRETVPRKEVEGAEILAAESLVGQHPPALSGYVAARQRRHGRRLRSRGHAARPARGAQVPAGRAGAGRAARSSASSARRAPPRRSTTPTSARSTRSTQHEGQHFIVMELLEGETLAELIRRGPLRSSAILRPRRSRSPTRSSRRTPRGSSTATSSRRTSSSTPAARRRSSTSAWRRSSARNAGGATALAGATAVARPTS